MLAVNYFAAVLVGILGIGIGCMVTIGISLVRQRRDWKRVQREQLRNKPITHGFSVIKQRLSGELP